MTNTSKAASTYDNTRRGGIVSKNTTERHQDVNLRVL